MSTDLLSALETHIRQIVASEVASLVDWVDQSRSPLGRKAHLALAKSGKVKASKIGKQVLIWRADLNAYIAQRAIKPVAAANDTTEMSELDRVRAELRAKGWAKKAG